MVKFMLSEKNVLNKFWSKTIKWPVCVLNRYHILFVRDIKSQMAECGMKHIMHHFRIFGCIAYAHVFDNLRRKLYEKSIICILLMLSEKTKAYKLYHPIRKKIVISSNLLNKKTFV